MKLNVKCVMVDTGFTPVVIINHLDAIRYDLHPRDRVLIETVGKREKRKFISVIDISTTDTSVKSGTIGLLAEAQAAIDANDGDVVDVHPAPKPESIKIIRKKMRGERLSEKELDTVVKDIVADELTEIELTYFVSAVSMHDLSLEEVAAMTKAVAKNGCRFNAKRKPVVDKHCIGGIPGNRTTMVVVPILAAFGMTIPKTSSRAITSPAGTADTMETLAKVSLSLPEMERVVAETGGCMAWGGSLGLAPADDKIIRIEKPMSIDAPGLMLSSVMAKKFSVGATHVLIDIPYGRTAKVVTRAEAEALRIHFLTIGKLLNMEMLVVLTDGSQPIGRGIGPLLEARDVMAVLQRAPDAPVDLRVKALRLAGEMLEFCGGVQKGSGLEVATSILESGSALRKMEEIIAAQGKTSPSEFRLGHQRAVVVASRGGVVRSIDNKAISKLARMAGAPITRGAGLYLHKKVGDRVKKGEALYTAYADSAEKIRHVRKYHEELKPYTIR